MRDKISGILYLWIGQGLSSFGGMIYSFSLVWFVYIETKSTFVLGTVLIVGLLPKIIFSILAGAVGDNISKKKLLIALDLIRTIITFGWGISLLDRTFTLVEVYIFTCIFSILDATFRPLYSGLIPELMKGKDLTKVVAINDTILKTIAIIAPAISGIAVIYFSFSILILFNAVTFLIAAALTALIQHDNLNDTTSIKKESIIIQVKSGFVYFYQSKIIFWAVMLISIANLAVVSYNVNLAALVQKDLKLSAEVYGMTLSFYSVGSLLSSFLISVFNVKRRKGLIYLVSLFIGGAFFGLLIFVEQSSILYFCFFCIGYFFAITSTISTAIIFELPEEKFRTRILGIASVSSFLSPIGLLIWGGSGELFGSALSLSISGLIIMAVALFGCFTPLRSYL